MKLAQRDEPRASGVDVGVLRHRDVRRSARLQARHLPHGLFVRLGRRFLRAYHATFVDSPHAVALAASRDGRVVGVLLGTLDTRAHQTWTWQRQRGHLAMAGVRALLTRPRLAWHVARTRTPSYARRWVAARRRRPAPEPRRRRGRERVAALLAVAVEPDTRGLGIGAALVERFTAAARAAGADRAVLVTHDDDEGAGPFYEGLGWRRRGVHRDRDGVQVREYERELRS